MVERPGKIFSLKQTLLDSLLGGLPIGFLVPSLYFICFLFLLLLLCLRLSAATAVVYIDPVDPYRAYLTTWFGTYFCDNITRYTLLFSIIFQ